MTELELNIKALSERFAESYRTGNVPELLSHLVFPHTLRWHDDGRVFEKAEDFGALLSKQISLAEEANVANLTCRVINVEERGENDYVLQFEWKYAVGEDESPCRDLFSMRLVPTEKGIGFSETNMLFHDPESPYFTGASEFFPEAPQKNEVVQADAADELFDVIRTRMTPSIYKNGRAADGLDEQAIVDWFFGLRIGIDLSDGTKAFNFPCIYSIGGKEIVQNSYDEFLDMYRLADLIVEKRGVDMFGGEPVGLEQVSANRVIFRVKWKMMILETGERFSDVLAYHLLIRGDTFRIYEIHAEKFDERAPVLMALNILDQTGGDPEASVKLMNDIVIKGTQHA